MKIVFDHQIFSFQRYGGVSRYFVELARHMPQASRKTAEVKILAPLHVNHYLNGHKKQLLFRGTFLPWARRGGRLIQQANSALTRLRLNSIGPDIIHETYYSAPKTGPCEAKNIITVYDMIHELHPKEFRADDPTKKAKIKAIERADHVICISENTREDLIGFLRIDPIKISVVHLGFASFPVSQENAKPLDRPFLLYVGARRGYKNFARLVEAYASSAQLRDRFGLAAFGGGPFNVEELALFRKLGLPDGGITQVSGNDELLGVYYKNAALFVYPSLYEGFGIPPLEAMSNRCPVACSNTSSIPEIVGDSAIFFDPVSVESIRDSLERALFDSELRESLVAKGLRRIRKFSWEKCAVETFGVYKKVLR